MPTLILVRHTIPLVLKTGNQTLVTVVTVELGGG
jgi:hypothetical protein